MGITRVQPDLLKYTTGVLDHKWPSQRPVLEVVRPRQPRPTFSASNTRESGIKGCTSALVVVSPTP